MDAKRIFVFIFITKFVKSTTKYCLFASMLFVSCQTKRKEFPEIKNTMEMSETQLRIEKDSVKKLLKAKSEILKEDIRKREARFKTARDMTKTELREQVVNERKYLNYLTAEDSIIPAIKIPDWKDIKNDIENHYTEIDSMIND